MHHVQPRIMWIDSSAQNLINYKDFLIETDFQLYTYQNPIDALKYIDRIQPHVILIDTELNEIDAFELTKKIRQSPQFEYIPIIFTLNLSDEKTLMTAYEFKSVDIMSKPCKKIQTLFRVNSNFEKFIYLQELNNQLAEVKEKHDQVETLARVLTHDISNSVMIIQHTANKLENHKLKMATQKITEIIDHVKEVLANKSGKIKVSIHPFFLADAITETIQSFSEKLNEKQLTITGNWRQNSEVQIRANEETFKNQVLANLISNAIKFSYPNSQITIDIGSKNEEIFLTIKDRGQGIPQDLIPKIFSRNEKTTRPGTANEQGTGFGLPIVKQYLELFQAKIEVESTTNPNNLTSIQSGTTFRIEFKK